MATGNAPGASLMNNNFRERGIRPVSFAVGLAEQRAEHDDGEERGGQRPARRVVVCGARDHAKSDRAENTFGDGLGCVGLVPLF